MTTERKERGFIKDLKTVPSVVFFMFSAMSAIASVVVYGFTVKALITGLLSVLLSACASSDIKAGIVPDFIVCMIACLAIVSFFLLYSITVPNLIDKLSGAFVLAVPMLACSVIIKGAYGGGDIKMMAACGLYLGWRLTVAGTIIAFLLAGLYALILYIRHKTDIQDTIPMAPFLAFGVFFASLFGENSIRLLIGY